MRSSAEWPASTRWVVRHGRTPTSGFVLGQPRIEVVRLDAAADQDDPGRLDIALEYRVLATQQTGLLTVALSLTGREDS